MTPDLASYAERWRDDWNSHDIERVLAHYDEAIRFHSPFAQVLTGSGVIVGKDALRAYWAPALAGRPGLHFHIIAAYAGHDSISIHYGDEQARSVIETLLFNAQGRIILGIACYAAPPMEQAK